MAASKLAVPIATPIARGVAGAGVGPSFASIVNNGVLAPYVTFTRASTATYFDSAGVMQTAAVNVPRVDYDPATLELRGLLVEGQRTNLLLRSQEFDNESWVKTGGSFFANAGVAPDGTLTADKFVPDTSNGQHFFHQRGVGFTSGLTYTASVYFKNDGRAVNPGIYFSTNAFVGGAQAIFNLSTGTVTPSGTQLVSATIKSVGGGWWRCTVTANCNATIAGIVYFDNLNNYTGDGIGGIFAWGAQLEAGAFATSYIPTTGSAVTRAADVARVADLSSIGYNSVEGSVYSETSSFGLVAYTYPPCWRLGVSADRIDCLYSDTSSFRHDTRVGGVAQASGSLVHGGGVSFLRTARAYKQSDSAYAFNGNAAVGIAGGTGLIPTVSALHIGTQETGVFQINGHIRTLRYYPRRLPDAQLQVLTA